ncbi:hypothetical protein BU15DRAFT_86106 [Melanogaster broomeanus]|nr:hypothetical protein BU15DRAFT_86106 [Melanogaster broomeanus]
MPFFKGHRSLLPSAGGQSHPLKISDTRASARWRPTRCFRLFAVLFVSSWAFILFYNHQVEHLSSPNEENPIDPSIPPLFEAYHEFERHLPQHDLSLPFPEGRDAKFFWAANHVTASGWGNVMQELLTNALLAHATNRAFVFDNFTAFRDDAGDFSEFNGKLVPSRIPLSAIISGPIVGSSFDLGDPTPRAVSREYYEKVCPNSTLIDSWTINEHLRHDPDVPASQIFDLWVEKLDSMNDSCVEMQRGSFQIFEIWLFGSTRILSLWPQLSKSPILRNFSWSPLVLKTYAANAQLFGAAPKPSRFFHRDFTDHCTHLAKWGSDWNGFNKFADFPDKFQVPAGAGGGEVTEKNLQVTEKIVEKVREVLAEQKMLYGGKKELNRIYVMTNGDVAWLMQLKEGLMGVKRWDAISSSRELRLGWESKHIAQSVDMLVGQQAQVFIGNGFSSLTSNIVMFRMLNELPPDDTRFW